MKRPLWIAGTALLVSLYFLTVSENAVFVPLFCIGIAISLVTAFWGKKRMFICSVLITGMLALASLFCTYMYQCSFVPQRSLYNKTVEIEGIALDFCDFDWGNRRVVLKNCSFFGTKTNARVQVDFPTEFSCAYGDRVKARVRIYSSDKSFSDFSQGVFLSGKSEDEFVVTPARNKSFVYYAKLLQKNCARRISEKMSAETASTARALLLGDKSEMPREFRSKLAISGGSHIFAVSGMHLSLWSAIIFLLLQKRSRTKILPNVAVSLFVVFYMALTGFSPSVIRAGIMLTTVYSGFCFRKPADGLNSLGLSALILLTASPSAATDISFLLSYASTAALFIVYPVYERHFSGTHFPLRKIPTPKKLFQLLANTVILSLSVLLFTVPLCSRYFGAVSLLSPVSSLLCTLPAEGIMLSCALALMFSPLPFAENLLFRLCEILSEGISRTVDLLSRLDFAYCRIDKNIMFAWYIISAAILFAVYCSGGKRKIKSAVAGLLCALFIFPLGIISNNIEAKQVTLTVYGGEATGNILFHSDLGATAALICDCESTYGAVGLDSVMNLYGIKDIDLMIVPTSNARTAKTAAAVNKQYAVKEKAGYFFAENDGGSFICQIKNGVNYKNYSDYNCGVLICNQVKTVMAFWADTDFSSAPEELMQGDILICRNQIPATLNPKNYEKVIIVSAEGEPPLPENGISTALHGTVNIKISSKEKRYACY